MNRRVFDGRVPVSYLVAAALAVAGCVAIVLLLGGPDYAAHGRKLALAGKALHDAREKGGETEAGSRHGGEGGEEHAREEGEGARDKREAAATIEGRKGGEGERRGERSPWAEQVANRA